MKIPEWIHINLIFLMPQELRNIETGLNNNIHNLLVAYIGGTKIDFKNSLILPDYAKQNYDLPDIDWSSNFLAQAVQYFYEGGLYQFIKIHYGIKHYANQLNYKDKKATKPFAEYFEALFEICKELHSSGHSSYANAGIWFGACLGEMQFIDIWELRIGEQFEPTDFVKIWEKRLEALRSIESSKKWCNPYRIHNIPTPAIDELMVKAYERHNTNDHFSKTFWKPLKIAIHSVILNLKTNRDLISVKLEPHNNRYAKATSSIRNGKPIKNKYGVWQSKI